MSYNVKFGASDAGFTSTVSKIKGSLNGLDDNARRTSKSFGTSFASMAKAGAALAVGFGAIKGAMNAVRGTLDNFKEALDMGGNLSELSARTGETAGNLMIMNRAFDNTGVGAEKVGATLNKLQRSIIEAGRGSLVQERAFKELGLSIQDLQYMAPIDQMRAVGKALSGIENDGKRTALAMDILGRSGGELLPLFTNIGGEIQTARDELGSLPGVMDRSAAAFDNISDKMGVMKGKLTEFAAGMLESALPALSQFIDAGSKLDASGFGQQIGQRLAEAFTMITSGDMWEIFKLKGEGAINSIRASDAMNGFAAGILTVWDGITSKFGEKFDFDATFKKYQQYGIEANTEIADTLDEQLSAISERQKSRMAEATKQMAADEAERAAKSGIMLKDIKQKPDSTKLIPDWLKKVQNVEKSTEKIASNMEEAAKATKTMADQAWESINAAKEKNKIDPGGRIQERINESLQKGNFGAAERAGNRLDRKEQEQRIQDAFGKGDSKVKESIADIAKEQGIDTKGKSSRQLREELDKKAQFERELREQAKKRQEEMKPGKGGKTKDEADRVPAKQKAEDMLLKAVQSIEKLVAKIEPKLPTHALGA